MDKALTPDQMLKMVEKESTRFKEYYLWISKNMPPAFFEDVSPSHLMLIIHNLMEFEAQEYFSIVQLKNTAIVLCLDGPEADLKILKHFVLHSIESYQTYISKAHPSFLPVKSKLRVVVLRFFSEKPTYVEPHYADEEQRKLQAMVAKLRPEITEEQLNRAIVGIAAPLLNNLSLEQLALVVAMYNRATTRDHCQYEVQYTEESHGEPPYMRIILAWRNTPKHNFLYRLTRIAQRHHLAVKRLNSSNKNPYDTESILVVSMEVEGLNHRPVWEVTNILDFVKELITVKYFASFDAIDHFLVSKGVISGNMGNLLRAMRNFIHQALVHLDANLYSLEHIEEGLCRHSELIALLCEAFKYRFSPDQHNEEKYLQLREQFLLAVSKLDTGHQENDVRRKNILRQGMSFVHHTLKTNFYRPNYTALSFRLDPKYMDEIPFDRSKKFPELPYAIIFIKGMHFFGFHIRFKDLARGGLRTVFPEYSERMVIERNDAFTECYNLAYTQQMKNKDIPEGGAKGIIFLKPFERLEAESAIYRTELMDIDLPEEEIHQRLEKFRLEQRTEHLYEAQRSFIENLITLVNCDADGRLRAKDIVDYWRRPEYLYLGPDENMHDAMIEWIAAYSKKCHYKPGSSFISGKPRVGINHKEYGATSLGLNVYVDAVLRYIGIDPTKTPFTVKMSGGPDGDVAGNEILLLQRFYPKTARLVALTDITGTVRDPEGLDLQALAELFHKGQGIRFYPAQKLHPGSFLVDRFTKRAETSLVQQTLCWRNEAGKLHKEWLSGSEMNHLWRHNIHQMPADIFITGGGRPRTLNENNYTDFLDATGKPTARAIVEGANLYLTSRARRALEELGTLIIKDSSANKTGVICSSFEVLSGLTLGDERFIANKTELVKEILERLHQCASNEAQLLLRTHRETGEYLTETSDRISKRINQFNDQLLDHLETVTLSENPNDPLTRTFLDYCLPLLRTKFQHELIHEIPAAHKKAIIACYLAANLVYRKGLSWFPSVVDILPVIIEEKK